jgi:uncharacterized protein (TIGR00369 family)
MSTWGPPKHPDYAERVRRSFAKQGMMSTIGAELVRVASGEVEIMLPIGPAIAQQHGFAHAGAVSAIADTAAGYAALSLMSAGVGVLTVEFKINLLAAASGERLIALGRVVRPGRTLTVSQAEVFAEPAGTRRAVALLTATLMAIEGRDEVTD